MAAVKVVAALLAAGASTRLGQPKQLVPFRGEPLVRGACRVLVQSRCQQVAVVLGANASEVADAVRSLAPVELMNERWADGIASSIRCAVAWAAHVAADALLLSVCDQPAISRQHLDGLIADFERTEDAVGSRYADKTGVPAIFPSRWFGQLGALHGDAGAGALLRSARTRAFAAGAFDVDTPDDLTRLEALARQREDEIELCIVTAWKTSP